MAEMKNTFIQSKMNQDLDGRILPNGQYREGINIQISKSEGMDVGALENILGNIEIEDFGINDTHTEIIGHFIDESNDRLFLFLTNYTDTSSNNLDNNAAGFGVPILLGATTTIQNYIISYNTKEDTYTILVKGSFLNFSKTHIITGINLVENLLFWTDNRNQPRKINVALGETANYYTSEDQISVAKYYPFDPILLLNENTSPHIVFDSSMQDRISEYLPIHASAVMIEGGVGSLTLKGEYYNIKPNSNAVLNGDLITGKYVTWPPVQVDSVAWPNPGETEITLSGPNVAGTINDLGGTDSAIYFQRQNPHFDEAWPGDPKFLKDKFVRFSYRFKFDDGEYSLMAPFTQIAFVPEQDGYFIGDNAEDNLPLVGQESETYDSTVLKFMENKVNDVTLNIPSPRYGETQSNWDTVNNKLHVIEIDILYRESDSNQVLVLDTLILEDFNNLLDIYLPYNYQSRKPWKTLPPKETTRVSDEVPIRALAQEVAGNRIIYGNFIDKHTSPETLDYTLQIDAKPELPLMGGGGWKDPDYYVRKEYQNHTLKQNRTYQVGVVLSDRYGRQSDVILSNIRVDNEDPTAKGSTIYHSYKNIEDILITDKNHIVDPNDTWPGDQLRATFQNIIPEQKLNNGYPGVYQHDDGSIMEVSGLWNMGVGNFWCHATIPPCDPCGPLPAAPCTVTGSIFKYDYTSGTYIDSGGTWSANVHPPDQTLVDLVVTGIGFVSGQPIQLRILNPSLSCPECDFNPLSPPQYGGYAVIKPTNPLGWYSWKMVVKQTEQEYYNVYLPGAMAGYPCDQEGREEVSVEDPADTITVTPSLPVLDYPDGNHNRTSHIVLFGDNINKIPRDLKEVGPTQDKFASSVRMYGRVQNIIDRPSWPDGAGGAFESYSNVQYDPGKKWDIAVTVATMKELNLGVLTPAESPTLPHQFYKSQTNPLIAKVDTRDQFGVSHEGLNPCSDTYSVFDDIENTWFGSGPTLAVYETAPVESLLDIFWETSTSGLVSELNYNIINNDNTLPIGISNPELNWSESDDYGTIISGDFQALGPNFTPLGIGCTIDLVEVTTTVQAGPWPPITVPHTPQFELEPAGGPGEYRVKIAPHSIHNPGFHCWRNPTMNEYTFKFIITRLLDGTQTTIYETGTCHNRAPNERNVWPGKQEIKDWTCDPNFGYYNGEVDAWSTKTIAIGQRMNLTSTYGCYKMGLNAAEFSGTLFYANEGPESGHANVQPAYGRIIADGSVGGSVPTEKQWIPTSSWQFEQVSSGTGLYYKTYGTGYYAPNASLATDTGSMYSYGAYFNWKAAIDGSGYGATTETYPRTGGLMSCGQYPLNLQLMSTSSCYSGTSVGAQQSYYHDWDGVFEATNGVWGSFPGTEPQPNGDGVGRELVFSIPRMYQVSMFVPYAPRWGNNGNTDIQGQGGDIIWMGQGEVVFGLYQDVHDANPDPDSLIGRLPSGPVYWHNNTSQLDVMQGGENIVGSKYNEYDVNGLGVYPHHYWPDLNSILNNANGLGNFANFRGGPNIGNAPNMMKLQNGDNTFYQFNEMWVDNVQEVETFGGTWNYGGAWVPQRYLIDNPPTHQPLQPNASGNLFWLGGIDPTTKLGDVNSNQKFFKKRLSPTPIDNIQKAAIYAGNPDNPNGYSGWSSPLELGNALPGGRYVVTLRVTDRSNAHGSSGLYFEWDVPITLPSWSVRLNPMWCCDNCTIYNG